MHCCLIGGTGRSGTTILKKIFSQHENVVAVPEWRIFIDPDGILEFYKTFTHMWSPYLFDVKVRRLEKILRAVASERKFWQFVSKIEKKVQFNHWIGRKILPAYTSLSIGKYCPNYEKLVGELMNELVQFKYKGFWLGSRFGDNADLYFSEDRNDLKRVLGGFLKNVIQSILQKSRKTHYLDDNTWNILWFDQMLELMPSAKLVHIYRDPRDVVASYIHQKWTPKNPLKAAQFYNALIERWKFIKKSIPEDSYIEISLEKLVIDTESILREVCRHWELSWDQKLLTVDLNKAHLGRWKKDIPMSIQDRFEDILSPSLEFLGY